MKKIFLYALVFVFTFSCVPDSTEDGVNPVPGNQTNLTDIVVFETNEEEYPFIFQHTDGDRLAAFDSDLDGLYDGVLFQKGDYEEFVEFDEISGLPILKIASNGVTVNYHYKENNTLMDLAITTPEDTYFMRNVPLDETLANKASKLKKNQKSAKRDERVERIRFLTEAIGIAGDIGLCLSSVGAYFAGTAATVGGLTLPGLVIPLFGCAPLAVNLVSIVGRATDNQLINRFANELDLADTYFDLIQCPINIDGCLEVLLKKMLDAHKRLIQLKELLKQELEQLKKDLERSAELVILGELNFREVTLDDTKTEVLTFFNRGTEPMTITSLEVHNNSEYFIIDPTVALPFTLGPSGSDTFSKDIAVTFAPKNAAKEYSTFLKILNDKYEPFDAKSITAIGTDIENAKIRFSGSLSYNGVTVDKPHSEFFDIENPNLNETITVTGIEFVDVPTDFFSIKGWKSGEIAPGKKQEVEVVFTPKDETPLSGFVKVNNDIDNIHNTIKINGQGKNAKINLTNTLWGVNSYICRYNDFRIEIDFHDDNTLTVTRPNKATGTYTLNGNRLEFKFLSTDNNVGFDCGDNNITNSTYDFGGNFSGNFSDDSFNGTFNLFVTYSTPPPACMDDGDENCEKNTKLTRVP